MAAVVGTETAEALGSPRGWSPFWATLREMFFPLRAFRPRSVVGIDIGTGAVKAVKILRANRAVRVQGWSVQELAEKDGRPDPQSLKNAVSDALTELGGSGDQVALNLSGPEVRVHRIHLPDLPQEELRQAVEWQVQKDLGGEDAPVVVGYEIQERRPEAAEAGLGVLAVSVPQQFAHGLLDTLGEIRVHRIGATPVSYASLLASMRGETKSSAYALVDVGGDGSWISFFRGGFLVYGRRIGVAGNMFTQSLTQAVQTPDGPLRYSLEEAEKVKRAKVLNLTDPAAEGKAPDYFSVLLRPVVEKLLAELERTIAHFVHTTSGTPVQRVYLSGGGSLLRGLPGAMASRLAIPVERLDPNRLPGLGEGAHAPGGLRENAYRLAAAIGTALDSGSEINLIPSSRSSSVSAAVVQTLLCWTTTGLLLSIPLLTGIGEVRADRLRGDLERARARYENLEPYLAQLGELAEGRKRLEVKRALASILPENPSIIPQVMKDLAERLPRGTVLNDLYLDEGLSGTGSEGESGNRKVVLSGEVHGSTEDLETMLLELLLELRSSPFYDDPKVTRKEQIFRGRKSALNFQIACRLN